MGRISRLWRDELSGRQVWLFFVFATMLHVLPLIVADYPYIDDNWRSLSAGTQWAGQGRLFTELFYNLLTFGNGAPNIFPLPLLIATLAMSAALTRLTFHYAGQPTLSHCLVVLPLWYTPFFLQNLSYQYDGPTMALSLVAVIYAITFRHASPILRWLWPSLLVALALGLYQLSFNVFLGLCCIEALRGAGEKMLWPQWCALIATKASQALLGAAIYAVTAYPFTQQNRTQLLNWGAAPWLQLQSNIERVVEKILLLFHGGFAWVFAAVLLCALVGAIGLGIAVQARRESPLQRCLIGLGCVLAVAAVTLLVSGMGLFFRDFNEGARTLMGFAVWLLLLFYLSHMALARLDERLPLLLVIPLLAMLSLSYAYGRVLTVQKAFTTSALHSLQHDIDSQPGLRAAKRIYLAVTYSDHWLVGAAGSFRQMPVLRFILNTDYYVLAESLPSVGITQVVSERERRNATKVGLQHFPVLVERKHYRIYLLGDYGFIVPQELRPIKRLHW